MKATTEHLFNGIHVFGEVYGLKAACLDDEALLTRILREGITASGATLCGMQAKKFEPQGLTLLALLSESHASLHTYPDKGALFFDAFTCGERCDPTAIARVLIQSLSPSHHNLHVLKRGQQENLQPSRNPAFAGLSAFGVPSLA